MLDKLHGQSGASVDQVRPRPPTPWQSFCRPPGPVRGERRAGAIAVRVSEMGSKNGPVGVRSRVGGVGQLGQRLDAVTL